MNTINKIKPSLNKMHKFKTTKFNIVIINQHGNA